jgi:hypothetical protein
MWFKRRKSAPVSSSDEPSRGSDLTTAAATSEGPSRQRSLAMRPARNRLVREEVLGGGTIRLVYLSSYKPWFAGLARRVGAWDGSPLARKLDLDELGTFCWNLIDGHRSAKAIAEVLAGRYALPAREAELAVAAFLRELGRRGVIGVREE